MLNSIDEMIARLRVVQQTLNWVSDECKKAPTRQRILEVFEALLQTRDALPIVQRAKMLGVQKEGDEVRLSLAATIIDAIATGCIVAGSQLGHDVERFAARPGPALAPEWEPRLESLYDSLAGMRDAIVAADYQNAWTIGTAIVP